MSTEQDKGVQPEVSKEILQWIDGEISKQGINIGGYHGIGAKRVVIAMYHKMQVRLDEYKQSDAKLYNDTVSMLVENKQVLQSQLSALTAERGKEKRKEAIAIMQWITDGDSKYAIMYGDQPERFADDVREYTSEEIYNLYLQSIKP